MLKLWCNNNGFKPLNLIYHFHKTLFYSTSIEKESPFFENYLINNLGFSKQQARTTSTKFRQLRQIKRREHQVSSFSKFVANSDSVVQFLKQNGLDDSQVRNVVSSIPNILLSKIDKTLKPKVDYFLNFGFSKPDFAQVVSINPFVLRDGQFVKAIETLKDVMESDDDVILIMKKTSWHSISCMATNLLPNVALLRSYGVPIELIRARLHRRWTSFFRKPVVFKDLLVRVEGYLGIPRDSLRFVDGIHLLSCLSQKNIESKIRMMEGFGWMRSDVIALIRQNPYCLALSEARIKRSLEFLMKELGYDPAYVVSHSAMIGYSLEKRIVPRYGVFSALKKKGLINKDYSFYSTLLLTEQRFLMKYVLPFEEVHEVYAKHTGRAPVKPPNEGRAGEEL